jgi:hypothetical protein
VLRERLRCGPRERTKGFVRIGDACKVVDIAVDEDGDKSGDVCMGCRR